MSYADELDRLISVLVKLRVKTQLLAQEEMVVNYENQKRYLEDQHEYAICIRAVRKLILHIEMLKRNNYPQEEELTLVLKSTADLFEGQDDMDLKRYCQLANEVQGKPYLPNANVFAGLMFVIGLCVFTVTLALIVASTGPASPMLFVGLAVSLLVYFGSLPVMELKRSSGISQKVSDVGSATQRYSFLENKHNAFFQEKKMDDYLAEEQKQLEDELGVLGVNRP
jgi:hypothetical protein